MGAGQPFAKRSGLYCALRVRIPLHPLVVVIWQEALAPMARGAGLECRKGAKAPVKVRVLQLPLPTTWPSGEAPACRAGDAGSTPAVVLGARSMEALTP